MARFHSHSKNTGTRKILYISLVSGVWQYLDYLFRTESILGKKTFSKLCVSALTRIGDFLRTLCYWLCYEMNNFFNAYYDRNVLSVHALTVFTIFCFQLLVSMPLKRRFWNWIYKFCLITFRLMKLHFEEEGHTETKAIRCECGKLFRCGTAGAFYIHR